MVHTAVTTFPFTVIGTTKPPVAKRLITWPREVISFPIMAVHGNVYHAPLVYQRAPNTFAGTARQLHTIICSANENRPDQVINVHFVYEIIQ